MIALGLLVLDPFYRFIGHNYHGNFRLLLAALPHSVHNMIGSHYQYTLYQRPVNLYIGGNCSRGNLAATVRPVYSGWVSDESTRSTVKQFSPPSWVLVPIGTLLCLSFLVVGIIIGIRGGVSQDITSIFVSPTQTSELAPHLSQEAILYVINDSIQSGKPLYLVGANLSGANLVSADLSGADLRTSDLSHADLYGANLSGANLFGAYLFGADLRAADLREADLWKTFLGKTDLRGANLSTAELDSVLLEGAWCDPNTILAGRI